MKKLIFTIMALTSISGYCDWPSVNHDHRNTRSNPTETILSPTTVGGLTLLQNFSTLPNAVEGAPSIVDGVAYFADTGGIVYARSASDLNTVVWPNVTLTGSISAPITYFDGTLYVTTGVGDLQLYALNAATGAILWNVTIDPTNVNAAFVLSGAVVVDNIVIVGCSDALNTSVDLFPVAHQTISAFNATTGAFIWRRVIQPAPYGAQGGSFSTAAVDRKLHYMFIGTSNSDDIPVSNQTDALLVLDYRTGEKVWSYQFTKDDAWGGLYPCDPDADVGAIPNLFYTGCHNDIPAVGVASKKGVYKVFNRKTGKLIWSNNTVPKGWHYISISAPGAAYDETTGLVYVPVLIDNTTIPFQSTTVLQLNGNVDASELIGSVYFSSGHFHISAIDVKSGKTKWESSYAAVGAGSVTAVNGVVYFTNFNGQVIALNGKTGAQLFFDDTTFPPVTFLGGATVVNGGLLYVPVGISGVPTAGGLALYGL